MTICWIAAALLALQSAQDARLQRAIVVQPETVTVGDPFTVTIRMRAPRGAEIGFPDAPDSAGAIEAVDPVQITTSTDSAAVDQTATYRLTAWDTGRLAIVLGNVRISMGTLVRDIPLGGINVFVASVLPADTALHVPKPARELLAVPAPWWWWLLIALAVALVVALLWWWWRRRRGVAAMTPVDAYEEALAAFARVESLGLVAAGERGRYVALMVEVLREYLQRIEPRADLSLTTSELLSAVGEVETIPQNRLAALLVDADLVKFARRPITAAHAAQLGSEARALVDAVHAAQQPVARAA